MEKRGCRTVKVTDTEPYYIRAVPATKASLHYYFRQRHHCIHRLINHASQRQYQRYQQRYIIIAPRQYRPRPLFLLLLSRGGEEGGYSFLTTLSYLVLPGGRSLLPAGRIGGLFLPAPVHREIGTTHPLPNG